MKQDVKANTTSSKQALEKIHEVEERVERNERNSRQMNLVIQGYVKNAAYNNTVLREEKFYLKQLLEQGLKLSAGQTKAIMDTIGKIHWLYGGKPHKVKGGSFLVRFDRQESIDTIYGNLPNLRDYKAQLPDGTKNHVSVKRDQTKAQKDQEAVVNHARSILKKQGTDTKVRSDGRGYYPLTEDKQKHYSDSKLVQDALEDAKKKQTENA
ncbi:hypothetical protein AAVH_23326 [Aphelenchoides avenae]|nr:hypothetical protein AAVH_23326 [Aphelenchus avenae]